MVLLDRVPAQDPSVSMESGLEDRNNIWRRYGRYGLLLSLNGVRPRRPEQSAQVEAAISPASSSQWSPA